MQKNVLQLNPGLKRDYHEYFGVFYNDGIIICTAYFSPNTVIDDFFFKFQPCITFQDRSSIRELVQLIHTLSWDFWPDQ
jgi:hypothetical protein